MNKAFVREPDHTADYCPRCGSEGEPVGNETVASHLAATSKNPLSDAANFCPSPRCEVVYFDAFEQVILTSDLRERLYPKDPTAPICPCFGLTADDIEQDVREGVVTRTKAALENAKSAAARCKQKSANGRSCIPFVQKLYVQYKNRS